LPFWRAATGWSRPAFCQDSRSTKFADRILYNIPILQFP